jgi:hypothetical protein
MNVTKQDFKNFIDKLPNKDMMESIIKDVHKNKKFTTWSILKIFFGQFTSNAFKSIKDGFIYLYKSVFAFLAGILSLVLFPIIFPIIAIYKVVSSKNHYKAGMEYFKIEDKDVR